MAVFGSLGAHQSIPTMILHRHRWCTFFLRPFSFQSYVGLKLASSQNSRIHKITYSSWNDAKKRQQMTHFQDEYVIWELKITEHWFSRKYKTLPYETRVPVWKLEYMHMPVLLSARSTAEPWSYWVIWYSKICRGCWNMSIVDTIDHRFLCIFWYESADFQNFQSRKFLANNFECP